MKRVYIIGCEDENIRLVKIGKSNNPEKRLRDLQTGNWVRLKLLYSRGITDYPLLEKELHFRFGATRSHDGGTEWFEVDSKEIIDAIDEFVTLDALRCIVPPKDQLRRTVRDPSFLKYGPDGIRELIRKASDRGISQKHLVLSLLCTTSDLENWEKGNSSPSLIQRLILAHVESSLD